MLGYAIRRLVAMVPLIIAIATVTFFLMHSVQGGPFDRERPTSQRQRAVMEARYSLDEPLHVQYVTYIGNLLQFDLGVTLRGDSREVRDIIQERMSKSLQLGVAAFIFATVGGLSLGVVSSLNQNGLGDYVGVFIATLGAAMPSIVLAPILTIVFAVELGWFRVLSND